MEESENLCVPYLEKSLIDLGQIFVCWSDEYHAYVGGGGGGVKLNIFYSNRQTIWFLK